MRNTEKIERLRKLLWQFNGEVEYIAEKIVERIPSKLWQRIINEICKDHAVSLEGTDRVESRFIPTREPEPIDLMQYRRLMTPAQVGAVLGVSTWAARNMAKKGKLEHVLSPGNRYWIKKESVIRYLEDC